MSSRLRFFVALAVVVGWINTARAEDPPGFKSLFNGKDLSGWNGNTELWKVENGAIVAESPKQAKNEFLVTDKSYRDFVFKASFKLKDGYGNSGIQFRSIRRPGDTEMIGYQADMGAPDWWGSLYDESRRNKVLMGPRGDTPANR